jgi:3,4-dihydroxy 2-butanone 4-phosphate synthase/GTP cyclohydrolase II
MVMGFCNDTRVEAFEDLTVAAACQVLRSGQPLLLSGARQQDEQTVMLCMAAQYVTPQFLSDLFQASNIQTACAIVSGGRMEALQISNEQLVMEAQARELCLSSHGSHDNYQERSQIYSAAMHVLADPGAHAEQLSHQELPLLLQTHPGGVLRRQGYAEGALDLLRMAGVEPVAFVCWLQIDHLDPAFLYRWHPGILAISDILRYRQEHRTSFITETRLPTALATFRLLHFQEIETGQPYLALLLGDVQSGAQEPPLLRLHSACATGDIFGSQRCDCQAQLHAALRTIAREGRGILLYLPQEGRGIGLAGKLQAYVLQDQGFDTLEANRHLGYPDDARDYRSALEVLRELHVTRTRLLTNNPRKIEALHDAGMVVDVVPLETAPTESNRYYLLTKQQRMGHLFTSLGDELVEIDAMSQKSASD